jgi:hypothetical protein
MVEMEWWPGVLVDEIQEKLDGWDVRDLGPVVRREREHPSGTELSLLRESAAVSARALKSGSDKALTQAQRRGRAELTARLSGVEDVYVFCDPATSEADTLEVFSEYRGYWTAAARVIAKGSPPWAPALARAYAAAERTLSPGVNRNRLSAAVEQALAGESIRWRLDLIDHTGLETRGDYRSLVELEGLIDEGAVAGLRLELTLRDGSRAVAADTYRIAQGGAERLTRDLPPAVLN